jgi:hypothetical protein
MATEEQKPLVLGWSVTNGLDPRYWVSKEAVSAGKHKLEDIVRVLPASIAHHTVIVAQSGSGKSFFLGRLIEEILLRTRSKLLVFDPNADFRKVDQIVEGEWWTSKVGYDPEVRRGFLPDKRGKRISKQSGGGCLLQYTLGPRAP